MPSQGKAKLYIFFLYPDVKIYEKVFGKKNRNKMYLKSINSKCCCCFFRGWIIEIHKRLQG